MKFLVISDAPILFKKKLYEAYAPYVKEMNLWLKYVDQATFLCPTSYHRPLLTSAFEKQNLRIKGLKRLEFHTIVDGFLSLVTIPYQILMLWNEMRKADHIHFRAPGNLCLLACVIQVLFPNKKKTAKYAGNWDPLSKQPLSYRVQRWILSSTLLTRNMDVLVYGKWEAMTKNIKPFFTASYFDIEKEEYVNKNFKQPLKAMFVGTISANKRPWETVLFIHNLHKQGVRISLDLYGDGPLKGDLATYIREHSLEDYITLHGNQPAEVVKKAYKEAHVLILLSKSEGWPKVVAEAMFWGVVPIVSSISCVPWMLDHGKRGILIEDVSNIANEEFKQKVTSSNVLKIMSKEAMKWSRKYTLDTFMYEIKNLLK